jgi:dTDP-4-dehydrorhamnose reductase
MIILLGGSGYIGEAFAQELARRKLPYRQLRRAEVGYTQFGPLLNFLRSNPAEFLINAAGYTGKPNVDSCEEDKAGTLAGNTLLPLTIAHACQAANVPWGHVSSGCIYIGAKIVANGSVRVEKDLTRPDLRQLVETSPESIRGFTEDDPPNFSFRRGPCSFYSGTKALAEEALASAPRNYIWRLRIPFDELDGPRNFLSKVQRYPKVYDNVNSISHRADFVRACLDLWAAGAPYGIYNVVNPGFVTTRFVVRQIEKYLTPSRRFEFWESDEEFYRLAARTLRSNCVMDASKLLAAGVKMRSVEEALADSLRHWIKEK